MSIIRATTSKQSIHLAVACLPFLLVSVLPLACQSAAADRPFDATADGPVTDGGTAETSIDGAPCAEDARSYCVSGCLASIRLVENRICSNGAWICPSGYVVANSCPSDGCGVTPAHCCDAVTGIVTDNSCGSDGHRQSCVTGSRPTDRDRCIPDALGVNDCDVLHGQPCAGPATNCRSLVGLQTDCDCRPGDAGNRQWICSTSIGP